MRGPDGAPRAGALVEVWQANAAVRYAHEGDAHDAPLDPNFTGAGCLLTDAEGAYRFTTVKPGAYPWKNHPNAWRPAHIHFSVFGRSFAERLVTQMYYVPYDLVGWAGFEPATSASRTGLQPCHQVILAPQGTVWRVLEPISLVVGRQDGGKRASARGRGEGFLQLGASDLGRESPTGARPSPRRAARAPSTRTRAPAAQRPAPPGRPLPESSPPGPRAAGRRVSEGRRTGVGEQPRCPRLQVAGPRQRLVEARQNLGQREPGRSRPPCRSLTMASLVTREPTAARGHGRRRCSRSPVR